MLMLCPLDFLWVWLSCSSGVSWFFASRSTYSSNALFAALASCASHLSHPGCIKNADRSAGTGDGTIFAVRRA